MDNVVDSTTKVGTFEQITTLTKGLCRDIMLLILPQR